ncbi:MAG: Uma2 family endonuclease [Limisphaerales bacterium]
MTTAALHKGRNGRSRQAAAAHPDAPSLLNGDHLSVPEFERRYEAAPDDERADLIEGIVIMSPPISNDHAEAHGVLAELLRYYARATRGVSLGVNASVRLDGGNEYQPDLVLRIGKGERAGSRIDAKGLLQGRPELVVEIALSSHAYDLHEKKAVYQRNQIPEYIVWQVNDRRADWFVLTHGEYLPLRAGPGGICRSQIFPGLWLDLRALPSGNDKKVFRALEKGLKSAEHKNFVKKLRLS